MGWFLCARVALLIDARSLTTWLCVRVEGRGRGGARADAVRGEWLASGAFGGLKKGCVLLEKGALF